jgi:pimeloyl-ACP methyl ester carboxylesterase
MVQGQRRQTARQPRGYSPAKVDLVRRLFSGEFPARQMPLIMMRIGSAYYSHPSLSLVARELIRGEWRSRMRPEPLIFAGRHLLKDWTVMTRLGEITVPTLVIAGRDDFLFPPEHQRQLAAAIPGARLQIIERAGHNPHVEQPAEVMQAIWDFIAGSLPPR